MGRGHHGDLRVADDGEFGAECGVERHSGRTEEAAAGDGHQGAARLGSGLGIEGCRGGGHREVLEVERVRVACGILHHHSANTGGAGRGDNGDGRVADHLERGAGVAVEGHTRGTGEAGTRDGHLGAARFRPADGCETGGDGTNRAVLKRHGGGVARGVEHNHVCDALVARRCGHGNGGVVDHGEGRARCSTEGHTRGSEETGARDGDVSSPGDRTEGRVERVDRCAISRELERGGCGVASAVDDHNGCGTDRARRSSDTNLRVADHGDVGARDAPEGDVGRPEEPGTDDCYHGAAGLRGAGRVERGDHGGIGYVEEVERVTVTRAVLHHNRHRAGDMCRSDRGNRGVADHRKGHGVAVEGDSRGAQEPGASDRHECAAGFGTAGGGEGCRGRSDRDKLEVNRIRVAAEFVDHHYVDRAEATRRGRHGDGRVVDHGEARAGCSPEGHTRGAGEARTDDGHHGATGLGTRGRVDRLDQRAHRDVLEVERVAVARVVEHHHVHVAEVAGGSGDRDGGVVDHRERGAELAAEGHTRGPRKAGTRDGDHGATRL